MRTRPPLGLLCLFCVLLAAHYATGAASFPVRYNPQLKISSRGQLEQRLREPFVEGTAHPAGVSNCAQLLAQRRRSSQAQASDRETQADRSTLAACAILDRLWRAKPARSSYLSDLAWNERVLSMLPPQLAIAVSADSERAAGAAAAQGKRWPAVDPSVTAAPSSKGPDQIMVTGNGFREQLILWGRGDFNGDGIEDLLVQSLDTLTQGTYRNTRLFILTRRRADGNLLLVSSLL